MRGVSDVDPATGRVRTAREVMFASSLRAVRELGLISNAPIPVTEPRWVRAVEVRPGTAVSGRRNQHRPRPLRPALADRSRARIPTAELNRFVADVQALRQPRAVRIARVQCGAERRCVEERRQRRGGHGGAAEAHHDVRLACALRAHEAEEAGR